MNKYIISTILLLSLTGCFFQTVDKSEIDLAEEACANNGGVEIILELFNGSTSIYCHNGFSVYEKDYIRKKKKRTAEVKDDK